jgi:hypothetical protein
MRFREVFKLSILFFFLKNPSFPRHRLEISKRIWCSVRKYQVEAGDGIAREIVAFSGTKQPVRAFISAPSGNLFS